MSRCISWTLQVGISFNPRLKLEKLDDLSPHMYRTPKMDIRRERRGKRFNGR